MKLNKQWKTLLSSEFEKEYFKNLQNFIENEYARKKVFPEYENIFRAFNLLSPDKVQVVIIGQDPYHAFNQANGLAFSVSKGIKVPPSLRNIYKELVDDLGCKEPLDGDLSLWATQGVLLFNTVFTVLEAKPNSHKARGWENFSDAVIKILSDKFENIVFILWGAPSQKKESLIDETKHLVLKSAHPSPLSAYRGFLGSKPFSKTNQYLLEHKLNTVDWCLPSQQTLL